MNAVVGDDGLHLTYDHRAEVYPTAYIEELAALYQAVLEAACQTWTVQIAVLVAGLDQQQQTVRQRAAETGRSERAQHRVALGAALRKPAGSRSDR